MSENWLVVGGAGYIGSHIVDQAIRRGFNVTVLDDLSTGKKEFIHPNVELVQGSLLDTHAIEKALSQFDAKSEKSVVVHLAAKKSPLESQKSPLKYWETNVIGTFNLVKACAHKEIQQFIFSSSCSVYGDSTDRVDENASLAPLSVYGRTKLVGEQLIRDTFSTLNTKFAILRYFNVVGSGNPKIYDVSETNLFPAILRSIKSQTDFTISGNSHLTPDGTCVRDYIHVSDLATAHLESSKWIEDSQNSITVNLGSGIGYSVLEIVNAFNQYVMPKISYSFGEPRDGDPSKILADTNYVTNQFGWQPILDLDDMVKSTLTGNLSNYDR